MSAIEISAPRSRFLDGLCKTQGYNVVTNGERVRVAFEPWAPEQVDAFEMPCLRLDFGQVDGRIVLERFTVENAGEEQVVNLYFFLNAPPPPKISILAYPFAPPL